MRISPLEKKSLETISIPFPRGKSEVFFLAKFPMDFASASLPRKIQ